MSFLLYKDVCSAQIRGVRRVTRQLAQHRGGLYVSTVTLAELSVWLLRRATPPRYSQGFAALVQNVVFLNLDDAIAYHAGPIGSSLYDQGHPIKIPSLLVAATALIHGLTLVTHDTQRFARIPNLTVVDWLGP